MSKNRLIFIVAALAIVAGTFWFAMRRDSLPVEPVYEGKTLTVWLSSESIDRAMINRIGLTDDAVEAVRAIGTNAIPYLLATLQYSGTNADAIMKRHRAATGFRALGSEASQAYPKLVSLAMTSPDSYVRSEAINAMMKADGGGVALLVHGLESQDQEVRARAALALFYAREAPDISLSALTEALNDPAAEVRASAVRAIGAYQEQARSLIPQVTVLLSDKNSDVKNGAAEALRTINLKAATP